MNVGTAPNAMIGEWRNCSESVPGANVQWLSQCMDGQSGWGVMVWVVWAWVVCGGGRGGRRREGGRGEGGERATDSIEHQNSHKPSCQVARDLREYTQLFSPNRDGTKAHALWPSGQIRALCTESGLNE